ncbi:MAG: hypothetical protein ACI4EO_02625 [Blautia sp.]
MRETVMEIMIHKIYFNHFTWWDLENYFNINRNILIKDLREFMDSEEQVEKVLQKAAENEKYSNT